MPGGSVDCFPSSLGGKLDSVAGVLPPLAPPFMAISLTQIPRQWKNSISLSLFGSAGQTASPRDRRTCLSSLTNSFPPFHDRASYVFSSEPVEHLTQ